MSTFTSMGCEIIVSEGPSLDTVRALFDRRDSRFSRFLPTSELNRVNAAPLGVMLVSEDFASMLSLALDAGSATGGLVTPAVGGAITAAGYDRDFADLPCDAEAVEPVAVQSLASVRLRGRMLPRSTPILLDLNGVVKGRTVDDALTLLGETPTRYLIPWAAYAAFGVIQGPTASRRDSGTPLRRRSQPNA